MAIQYTPYPITTTDGRPVTVKTAIDPTNPSTPPRIVDKNNSTLYQWNVTTKKWEPLGSSEEILPSNLGFSTTETYGSLLNAGTRVGSGRLTSNNQIFTDNTVTVINKLPQNQKNAIRNSNSYQPYNNWDARTKSSPKPGDPRDEQGGNSPVKPATTQDGQDSIPIPESTTPPKQPPSESNSPLKYPYDMRDDQDRIKFTAVEYAGSLNLGTGKIGTLERKSVPKTNLGTVFLPIQSSIMDRNTADWQGGNLNYLEQTALNASLGAIKGNPEQFISSFNDALNKAQKSVPEIQASFAAAAVGVEGLLNRAGTVLNPNLELLFTGPQLRSFNFTFKLSARNSGEAKTIKQIINFFKRNMSVKRNDDGIFLKAPNTFFIEYQIGTTKHQSINQIKECALTDCSVDYTPLGTYMTFNDTEGTMVSYSMTLSFQELVPIYKKDYDDNHPIGY